MIYAIMLDNYQRLVSQDQYCVSFSGTLAACQAATDLPDGYETWAKSDYSNVASVGPHSLGTEPGEIYSLQLASEFAAEIDLPATAAVNTIPVKDQRPQLLAALGAGLAIGFILGALIGETFVPKSRQNGAK